MDITEYGVLKNLSLVNLINEMDKLILAGWQPAGGIAVTYGRFSPSGEATDSGAVGVLYAQAIVKNNSSPVL